MKKKICVIVVVALLVLMLIPSKMNLEDGGTKVYRAVLYTVTDWHRFNDEYSEGDTLVPEYIEGVTVRIFGMLVYDSRNMIQE